RAIADMARSLDLPEEIKAKLENPRTKVFTTLARVFDSSIGREYLKVEPDPDHGLRGKTSKSEFVKGFTKLVSDVSLGKESSRTLNSNEDIKKYFESWNRSALPYSKGASFVPADVIKGRSVASAASKSISPVVLKKPRQQTQTVLPRDFRVRHG